MGDPVLTQRPVTYSHPTSGNDSIGHYNNNTNRYKHSGGKKYSGEKLLKRQTYRKNKLANEREKLQRPESQASENGYEDQVKLQQAMLRRQELLDRIRQEQQNDNRPRTYTPRRRYTPTPLLPPSRRSLPDINSKHYHFGVVGNGNNRGRNVEVMRAQQRWLYPRAVIVSGRGRRSEISIQPSQHLTVNYPRSHRNFTPFRGSEYYSQNQFTMASPSPAAIEENNASNQREPHKLNIITNDPGFGLDETEQIMSPRPIYETYSADGRQGYALRRLPSRISLRHVPRTADMTLNYPGAQQYPVETVLQMYPPSYQDVHHPQAKTFLRQTPHVYSGDMAQVKHVIEHQFRSAPQHGYTQLPPIQPTAVSQVAAVQPLMYLSQPVTPQEVVAVQPTYAYPTLAIKDSGNPKKDTMFNKSDFMDMMMLQNAQMHHMVMQQMMLHQLPGGSRPWTLPFAEPAAPVALMRPSPSVYHHHINQQPNYSMPPMDYRGGGGNGYLYGRNYNSTIYDDGSNYYHYH